MAQKFHVSADGIARVCTAKGQCPLGGENEHFDTIKEAQAYADKKQIKEHGILPSKRPIKIPPMYEGQNFEINDPNGLLDKDLSVEIPKGEYMLVYNDGIIELDNSRDPLVKDNNSNLDVEEIAGEKVYRSFYHHGGYYFENVILKKETYIDLKERGLVNEEAAEMYDVEDTSLTITKDTRLALDPYLDSPRFQNADWGNQDKDFYNYGFHFKDSDAFKDSQGILNKEINDIILKMG